jgi:hypothetical protein
LHALRNATFFGMTEGEVREFPESQKRYSGISTGARSDHHTATSMSTSRRPYTSKKRKKLRGTVEKEIKSKCANEPEKAEINIKEADDLYREIRVENTLTDDKGEKRALKPGAEIDVVIEADTDATVKKEG